MRLIVLYGCIRKLRQLTYCLAALWGNDFAGSVFAQRHLTKLILDMPLRQRDGLMIYNKIERVLVITKRIFNYYNTHFSLEIASKVQKVNRKYTFTHKLSTKRNFRTPSLFFLAQPSRNGTHRIVGYQRQRRIHLCCLQKSIRWRYLMRQEVKLTLDSDVPWCLPASEGSIFQLSDAAYVSLSFCTSTNTCVRCACFACFVSVSALYEWI